MSPEDWKHVEAAMSSPWGVVTLKCDQFKLTIQVQRKGRLTYCPVAYVDGVFKGAWCNAKLPCEEQRRFMRPVFMKSFKPTFLKKMKGLYSAKQLREMAAKRHEYFSPEWPSFGSLRRHLEKNNQVIELVRNMVATDQAVVTAAAGFAA